MRNPIDAFVLARLEKEGLAPTPESDPGDVAPPGQPGPHRPAAHPAEVDAFLADTAPTLMRRLVDRSGLARTTASAGPALARRPATPTPTATRRTPADHLALPRLGDQAFNRDLPFDRFTVEQLAGDLLPNAHDRAEDRHRLPSQHDGQQPRAASTTRSSGSRPGRSGQHHLRGLDGLDARLLQCHNHKYDPFTKKDYYSVFAFFNNTADRGGSNTPEMPVVNLLFKEDQERLATTSPHWKGQVVPGHAARPGRHPPRSSAPDRPAKAANPPTGDDPGDAGAAQLRSTLVMIRGNFRNHGEEVKPGVPAHLHPLRPALPQPGSGFARWLVDPANPLVGRVTMNRIWARYFGKGLVETSEEFGVQGELPTHPELIDFLAVELIERKWSLKTMHRLIVTSATYRQSRGSARSWSTAIPSIGSSPAARASGWTPRWSRDNALAISGLLVRRLGGPSVFPYQPDGIWANPYSGDRWVTSVAGDQYRRGLYTFWRRTAPYAVFMAFDAQAGRSPASAGRAATRRSKPWPRSTIASSSRPSAALARRIVTEVKPNDRDRLTYAFRLCVARAPTEAELDILLKLYAENLEKYRKNDQAARALVKQGADLPRGVPVVELVSWTVVANVLLNLDETITK